MLFNQLILASLIFAFGLCDQENNDYGKNCGTQQYQRFQPNGCSASGSRCWAWCHSQKKLAENAIQAKGKWCYTSQYYKRVKPKKRKTQVWSFKKQKWVKPNYDKFHCQTDEDCQHLTKCKTRCDDNCWTKLSLKVFGKGKKKTDSQEQL